MRFIVALFVLMFAVPALAVDDMPYVNPQVNGTMTFKGNKDGVFSDMLKFDPANDKISVSSGKTLDVAGRISSTGQPSFRVHRNADSTALSSAGAADYSTLDVEDWDYGGNFSNSTFVAPVAGHYHLQGSMRFLRSTAGQTITDMKLMVRINSTDYSLAELSPNTGGAVVSGSGIFVLNAGDTVRLYYYATTSGGGTFVIKGGQETYLAGFLLPW